MVNHRNTGNLINFLSGKCEDIFLPTFFSFQRFLWTFQFFFRKFCVTFFFNWILRGKLVRGCQKMYPFAHTRGLTAVLLSIRSPSVQCFSTGKQTFFVHFLLDPEKLHNKRCSFNAKYTTKLPWFTFLEEMHRESMLTLDTVLCRMGRTLRKDNCNTLGDNSRILAYSLYQVGI